jgi:FdhD protein
MALSKQTRRRRIVRYTDGVLHVRRDVLAVEEPLAIRLRSANGDECQLATTMRTPGHDFELVVGLLAAEGIIGTAGDVVQMSYCVDRDSDGEQHYNVVSARLRAEQLPDLDALVRRFTVSSSCGVCGRAGLDELHTRGYTAFADGPVVAATLVAHLPELLRAEQDGFTASGGLHAAALFDASGQLLAAREDIGRHNAVDKVLGWALLNVVPAAILLVSGRASYEIVQKALAAAIPIVCAVSAPSSLAAQLAQEFNMTLIGFLRGSSFNIYSAEQRCIR